MWHFMTIRAQAQQYTQGGRDLPRSQLPHAPTPSAQGDLLQPRRVRQSLPHDCLASDEVAVCAMGARP